jgi:thiamine-monophosphate kinase
MRPVPPPLGEFDLIARIRSRTSAHARVPLGIGDDCAALTSTSGRDLLVTTDMLMDGRHFRLDECTAEEAGHKALAVNLSDIAAMAGRPLAAFVAVALPRDRAAELAEGLEAGMRPLAERFGVALAGGDTNAWDGPLVVCVTLVGEAIPPGPVKRSGARVGDIVVVTGPLGGSIMGRHLRPTPRIAEAQALHRAAPLHALIDISDGLAADLGHILEESGGLGAVLVAENVPIHEDTFRLAPRDGRAPLEHALGDGEDFELCATLDPADAACLLAQPPPGVSLFRVGTITAQPGLRLLGQDGIERPIDRLGFDHFRTGPS